MNISVGLSDILLVSPMIALFLISLLPITIKVLRGNKEQPGIATLTQGILGLIVAAGLISVFGGSAQTAFNGSLLFDGMAQWMSMIAIVAVGFAMVLMHENPATKGNQFSELIFLTMSSTLGMLVLIHAVDLLTVFIGLEMMSLPVYLMIAMSHEERLSKESALKYFVLGSFASALFLYGVAFVFGSAQTTNVMNLLEKAPELIAVNKLFVLGITLVILGFCFKVSMAPFHAWTPDVYQGAPTPHTNFMATAVKTVSFAAFLRIAATKVFAGNEQLFDFLQWIAVITMLVGNVAAVIQGNLKRVLAYSSIAHSGYVLVGVITAGVAKDGSFGASGVIFYLLSYTLMTFGAFAVVHMLEKSEGYIVNVEDLAGLASKRPVLAFCLTIFMLSLAGIPPAIGFFGKFYIFTAAIGQGLMWLALWGVINSVISVYYYLRPIVVMYMKEGDADIAEHSLNGTTIAVVVAALLIVILGVASGPLFQLVEKSLS